MMLAFAFVGSRRPRSCCHLKVAECPFEKSRPEAQATSKKEVGIRNTLHNRYSAPRPAGGPPEVPRRPIQVGHRKLYSGFMQGCGYGMGVVAAVTRTFPVKPVCVCACTNWCVGEEAGRTGGLTGAWEGYVPCSAQAAGVTRFAERARLCARMCRILLVIPTERGREFDIHGHAPPHTRKRFLSI